MDGVYGTGEDCPDGDGYRIDLTIDRSGQIRQSLEIDDDRFDAGGSGEDPYTYRSTDDYASGDDGSDDGSDDCDEDVEDRRETMVRRGADSDGSGESAGREEADCPPVVDDCPPVVDGPAPAEDDCPPVESDCPPERVGLQAVPAEPEPVTRAPVTSAPATIDSVTSDPVAAGPVAAGPVPDLDDHPALAAIDAQGTQDTLNALNGEVEAWENRLGMPGGVPTAETALQGVQAPGGRLQTTSGMPLVTLGAGGVEGSILSAALAPLPGGLDPGALILDENGMLRPNAGVWAPSLAALRGQSVDPALAERFGSQLNDPDPIGFGSQDPDPSLIPPSER